jgi:hypothetical protein
MAVFPTQAFGGLRSMVAMTINWTGVLLAPLAIPFTYSAAFAFWSSDSLPLSLFMICFVAGSLFSYGVTTLLFLPCLYALSRIMPLTAPLTCFIGGVLGAAGYLPVSFAIWHANAPGPGLAARTWIATLLRDMSDPIFLAFPFGGLVTAGLFWLLVNGPARQSPALDDTGSDPSA